MIKKILIGLLAIVIVFVIIVALQPPEYRVVRSASISAPPATVFAQVNDFHNWQAWSTWAKLDPGMKQSYEGPPAGTGAIYSWVGNAKVGEGRMTLTESRPNELIRIKLDFIKPLEGHNVAEFALAPQGDSTSVTWTMDGPSPYVGKLIGVFVNMDTMIGKEFETGLANLKGIAEKQSHEQSLLVRGRESS